MSDGPGRRGLFDRATQRTLGGECIFKMAVRSLVAQQKYPSPKRLHDEVTLLTGRPCTGDKHVMNGRWCRWRREVLAEYPDEHWVSVQRSSYMGRGKPIVVRVWDTVGYDERRGRR